MLFSSINESQPLYIDANIYIYMQNLSIIQYELQDTNHTMTFEILIFPSVLVGNGKCMVFDSLSFGV